MIVLAIDSCGKSADVAVIDEGIVLSQSYINCGLTHSKTLLTLIDNVLKQCEKIIDDIDLVAVVKGPGSFTGVRIGVSLVKGLIFEKNIPVCPVSSLEAMANTIETSDCNIISVMDAKCGKLYVSCFEKSNDKINRINKDECINLNDIYSPDFRNNNPIVIIGDDNKVVEKMLNGIPSAKGVTFYPNMMSLGAYRAAINSKDYCKIDKLEPDYIMLSQAESNLQKKI